MAILDSSAQAEMDYSVPPAELAKACQEAIVSIGLKISAVSRESGIIRARTPVFGFTSDKSLTLTIAGSEAGSRLHVEVSARQGIFGTGEGQKFLAKFLSALAAHPSIAGRSIAGW